MRNLLIGILFAMISLNACQQAIIESNNIEVSWLFTLIDANDVRYKWSTKNMTTHGEATVWEDGVEWESGVSWDDGLWKAGHMIHQFNLDPGSISSVDADDNFIYSADTDGDGLRVYIINLDGKLTAIGSPTSGKGGGYCYVYSDILYARDGFTGFTTHLVGADGSLTLGDTYNDVGFADAEDFVHTGSYLCVAAHDKFYTFSINETTGGITEEDSIAIPASANGIAFDGDYIFVASITNGVYSHSIDGAGQITAIDNTGAPGGVGAHEVTCGAAGLLYVTRSNGTISTATVAGDGTPAYTHNFVMPSGATIKNITYNNGLLYASAWDGGVHVLEPDASGKLNLIDNHYRASYTYNSVISGKFLLTSDQVDGINSYRIAGNDGFPEYSFRIKDFNSIEMSRPASESSIQMPASVRFTIVDQHDTFTASDFIDGTLWIALSVEDKTTGMSSIVDRWRFTIRSADAQYKTIKCVAESFFAKYLEGEYPNTQLPKAIFPSDDSDISDNLCVPVPFGTCYIPLRFILVPEDGRYYLLGPTTVGGNGVTYTITKVRAPRELNNSEWDSGSYAFTQSTKADSGANDWRVFQAIINDSDLDGTADASAFWLRGEQFYDILTQFSRSDTASLTSPEEVIQFVLEDMGVPTALIDVAGTFATAGAVYSGWGLTFNGAFWYKMDREKALSMLLYMCHSTLIIGETIELHVLSKTSQGTIDSSQVLNTSAGGVGEGTFKYDTIIKKSINDSGHIAWQEADQPQDAFMKALVPAKSTTNNIAGQTLDVPFVQDDQLVQTVGSLVFQRKFLGKATLSFSAMPENLVYRPDDVLTMSGANYGASTTYDFVVEKVRINHDLSVEIEGLVYSDDLDDWGDLSPSAITPATDDTAGGWGPLSTTEKGVEIYRAGAGTTNLITYQDDALADDGTVNLPDATSGMVFVTCNDEFLICHIKNDGTVKPVMASELTALTDSDTNLCIYDDGTQAVVKNRLGATGKIRVFYFYN